MSERTTTKKKKTANHIPSPLPVPDIINVIIVYSGEDKVAQQMQINGASLSPEMGSNLCLDKSDKQQQV